MTDAEIIQLERQIEYDTEVTQIRLNSQYCPTCGTRKIRGKCEYCEPDAEKQRQAENSVFYAKNIPPRTCPLCGDRIRPAANRMTGEWWMMPSHAQIWRCEGDGCGFVGTFSQFCDESDRQAMQQPVKDFSMDEVAEIPY